MGKALARHIAEGNIQREDVFITSKLFGSYHQPGMKNVDTEQFILLKVALELINSINGLKLVFGAKYSDKWSRKLDKRFTRHISAKDYINQ